MLAVLAAALAGLVLAAAGLLAQHEAPAEAFLYTPQTPPGPYER